MRSSGRSTLPDAAPVPRNGRPATARRAALLLLVWAVLTGLLIVAGEAVEHSPAVTSFDHHVTSIVVAHRTGALDTAMKVVTWLGSWVAVVVAAALLLTLALRRRLPVLFAIAAVAAWAGEQGATTLAKNVVERSRPPEALRLVTAHGWSWPSGHAATGVLVFTVLAAMVWQVTGRAVVRTAALALAAVSALAVAFSRVELGVHWTTDVLASVVFVSVWLAATAFVFRAAVPPAG